MLLTCIRLARYLLCHSINNRVFHFGLTELFQFQLQFGKPVLIHSCGWETIQVGELELSMQDVFHVNIHTLFYQKELLRIMT